MLIAETHASLIARVAGSLHGMYLKMSENGGIGYQDREVHYQISKSVDHDFNCRLVVILFRLDLWLRLTGKASSCRRGQAFVDQNVFPHGEVDPTATKVKARLLGCEPIGVLPVSAYRH